MEFAFCNVTNDRQEVAGSGKPSCDQLHQIFYGDLSLSL